VILKESGWENERKKLMKIKRLQDAIRLLRDITGQKVREICDIAITLMIDREAKNYDPRRLIISINYHVIYSLMIAR
jgi:hypothetical protein